MDPPGPPGAGGHWRLEDNSFVWDPRNMVRQRSCMQASACLRDTWRSRRRQQRAPLAAPRLSRDCCSSNAAPARQVALPGAGPGPQVQRLQPALASPADQRSGGTASVRRSAGGATRGKSSQRVEKKCQARSSLCNALHLYLVAGCDFCARAGTRVSRADLRALALRPCTFQVPQCGEVLDPTKLRPYNIRYR